MAAAAAGQPPWQTMANLHGGEGRSVWQWWHRRWYDSGNVILRPARSGSATSSSITSLNCSTSLLSGGWWGRECRGDSMRAASTGENLRA